MNKQDLVLIATRIFGIYLVVLGLSHIPWLYINYLAYTPNIIGGVGGMGDPKSVSCIKLAKHLMLLSTVKLLYSLLQVTLFLGVGIYLIRNGKIIFNLIKMNNGNNHDHISLA